MKTSILLILLLSICGYSQENVMKNDWANLAKYATENKNLNQTASGEHRIVFMGDSITEFWKIQDGDFFALNPFIDRGISGQTTPQMVLRFQQDVVELKPSKVVILAGINDIAENTGPISLQDIMKNIIAMVELAKTNKITPILCSVLPANKFPWRPDIAPADKVIQLNKMIKSYAKKNKLVYVDYYSSMVDKNKGLKAEYGEDGVHPNKLGYKIMESILLKKRLNKL